MPTQTRERGTEVTSPATGAERIAAIRRIVERKQYAVVDGCMIDLFSASAIVAVYDKLGAACQEIYASKRAPVMAKIAFKLIK